MSTCSFAEFMDALKPWLNSDYIRHAQVDGSGRFTLSFVDGGQRVIQIDDCTGAQLKDIAVLLKENGVQIVESNPPQTQVDT